MESRVVGVAKTVRGRAMRSRSQRISSLGSSSSGTQSMARSASRTASSMVVTRATPGLTPWPAGPSSWRRNSWAWCRLAGITSSSCTRKPARAALKASQRPSGPAPMMATVSGKRDRLYGQNLGDLLGARLAGQGLGHIVGAGTGLQQVLRDAEALLVRKRRDGGQHPAQGHGNVVNVVHQANGFSGERHGFLEGLNFPSSL